MRTPSPWRDWLLAALLYLPMAAVVLAHLLLPPDGRWPTGFLQYDQQGYMAMAREAWEGGAWPLFGLPGSDDPATPQHYLYLHIALLGALQGLFELEPGRLYLAFGALSGLVFLRLAIALYRRVVPQRDGAASLGLLLFAWGGGLFTLAGLGAGLAEGHLDYGTAVRFDPAGGFWFLNLGRNLFYGVEAWYHALALGLLLALLDRRWRLALSLLAALALSHPFTGLQLLLTVAAWFALERALRCPAPLAGFGVAVALLLLLFLAYHFWLLPQGAEHRALMARWSLDWSLGALAMLLAYGLLLPPALLQLRREGLAQARTRLLLTLLLVSLALAQHDLLIAPRQPLHFTRGYIWMPLFLLGAPLLVAWLRSLLRQARPLALALVALLLLDNAAWLTLQAVQNAGGFGAARTLSGNERAAFAALSMPRYAGHLLVPAEPRLGYDATLYTPLVAWYGHEHATPDGEARLAALAAWPERGVEPAAWRARDLVFLLPDPAGTALPPAPAGERERIALPGGGEPLLLVRRPAQQ